MNFNLISRIGLHVGSVIEITYYKSCMVQDFFFLHEVYFLFKNKSLQVRGKVLHYVIVTVCRSTK